MFLAVALPALLALVGLAIDLGRFFTLDTELAEIADAAALSAASRLDLSDGAIPAARAAGDALRNQARSGEASSAPMALTYRFAENVSDLLASPIYTLADTAGSQASAVEVRTAPRSVVASFLSLVGANSLTTRRRAIARARYYACDVTPAAVCHRDPDAFAAAASPGRQYLFRANGSVDTGALVLLDAPGDATSAATLRNLASDHPAFCHSDNVRVRRPTNPQDWDAAVNVRFDRYFGDTGPIPPDLATFPPAPIVISGKHLNSCTSPPSGGSIAPPYALPRDSAFRIVGPGTSFDAGRGDWRTAAALGGSGLPVGTALNEYLAWNHGNKSPIVLDRFRQASTRYDVYLAELGLTRDAEATAVPTRGVSPAAATLPTGGPGGGFASVSERPIPFCYAGRAEPSDPRRRVLYLPVVDCANLAPRSADQLSRHVGKFFLTEPSDRGAVLLEFVNILTPAQNDGRLRRVIDLVGAD